MMIFKVILIIVIKIVIKRIFILMLVIMILKSERIYLHTRLQYLIAVHPVHGKWPGPSLCEKKI